MKRLWVDLTTSYQDVGRTAHGTVRVERSIVGALAERGDPRIGFVVFDWAMGRFQTLSAHEASRIVTAPTRPERDRELASVWKRRLWGMQARLRRFWPSASHANFAGPGVAAAFASGDTVFFPGEHSRHDFAHLAELKKTANLAFVFLFYDLLTVLEDHDPRLRLGPPDALPQTDFMVREATLFLSISRFSGDILQSHLIRRGAPIRPIEPIRLAGHRIAVSDPASPVPDLVPGGFVLSVGDVVHRKNHKLLVQVWSELVASGGFVPTLVIVGRIDLEGNALVRTIRQDPSLRGSIRFLPNVNDAVLLWLYRNCRYTVFPSLQEGFGLPVAESLSHEKVCLASSATSIPEAGQGAAIALDPADAAAWAAEVTRLNDDTALAEEQARITCLFRPVTWSDTAEEIVSVLTRHGHFGGEPA
jgi:glycosyltransferase involved in cell wall biosynthesis